MIATNLHKLPSQHGSSIAFCRVSRTSGSTIRRSSSGRCRRSS